MIFRTYEKPYFVKMMGEAVPLWEAMERRTGVELYVWEWYQLRGDGWKVSIVYKTLILTLALSLTLGQGSLTPPVIIV